MAVCGDSLTLGASLKQPLEKLQFWQLLHISAPEVPSWMLSHVFPPKV